MDYDLLAVLVALVERDTSCYGSTGDGDASNRIPCHRAGLRDLGVIDDGRIGGSWLLGALVLVRFGILVRVLVSRLVLSLVVVLVGG